MKSEPLRVVLLPIALAAFAAAGQAFLNGANTRAIITAALGALIVAAQEYARTRVTPVPQHRSSRSTHLRDQRGYSIVEAILIVFLVAVVLIVLFHFA